ncbi:hypothetical protein Patl1_01026 [Pistacia atlantica]|uniref:Uncharacterized protein n=1 Tax=Pistacia atlantica TaxID=434234 RepID=A0ACC1C955_9ROSI|nr:hypothetical protein Patl1_01026 [Pistacia atlantica]
MDGHDSEDPKQSTADMTVFCKALESCYFQWDCLDGASINCFLDFDALDEMGGRINELEQSINDLRAEMGVEGSPSPLAPSKPKQGDGNQDESSA